MVFNKDIIDAANSRDLKKADEKFVAYCVEIVRQGADAPELLGVRYAYVELTGRSIKEVDSLLGFSGGSIYAYNEKVWQAVKKLVAAH